MLHVVQLHWLSYIALLSSHVFVSSHGTILVRIKVVRFLSGSLQEDCSTAGGINPGSPHRGVSISGNGHTYSLIKEAVIGTTKRQPQATSSRLGTVMIDGAAPPAAAIL